MEICGEIAQTTTAIRNRENENLPREKEENETSEKRYSTNKTKIHNKPTPAKHTKKVPTHPQPAVAFQSWKGEKE